MPPSTGIFRLRGLSEEVHNRFGLPHNGNGGSREEGETGKVDLSAFPTCWLSERRKDGFGIAKRQLAASNGPITERDRFSLWSSKGVEDHMQWHL